MSLNDDPVAALSRALDQLIVVVSRITPEQATLPTPCASWDVRAVVGHVLQDTQGYAAAAGGGAVSSSGVAELGDDWSAGFREPADALLTAWRAPGALERTISTPMGEVPATMRLRQQVTEFTLHGWDLARATGQEDTLDPALVEVALRFGQENMRPQFRGSETEGMAFGPELEPPSDASEYERLAAFFGRDPRALRPAAR